MAPPQSTKATPLQHGVAVAREHDPEIKDMASYIHNYKIDSDLAVRIPSILIRL